MNIESQLLGLSNINLFNPFSGKASPKAPPRAGFSFTNPWEVTTTQQPQRAKAKAYPASKAPPQSTTPQVITPPKAPPQSTTTPTTQVITPPKASSQSTITNEIQQMPDNILAGLTSLITNVQDTIRPPTEDEKRSYLASISTDRNFDAFVTHNLLKIKEAYDFAKNILETELSQIERTLNHMPVIGVINNILLNNPFSRFILRILEPLFGSIFQSIGRTLFYIYYLFFRNAIIDGWKQKLLNYIVLLIIDDEQIRMLNLDSTTVN